MRPRFLLDENLSTKVAGGLERLEVQVDITYIGADDTLPLGTLDPDILLWIEQNGYILVTNNRHSMPVHVNDHFATGHHFPGIISLTREMDIGELITELHIIWGASEAEEYFDRFAYIPL